MDSIKARDDIVKRSRQTDLHTDLKTDELILRIRLGWLKTQMELKKTFKRIGLQTGSLVLSPSSPKRDCSHDLKKSEKNSFLTGSISIIV